MARCRTQPSAEERSDEGSTVPPLTFLFMARSAELKCPPLTLLGGTRAFAWPTYGLHRNRTQSLTRSDRTATRERRGQRKGTKLKPKSWPVPAPRLTEPGGHEALPPSARGAVARNAIRDDSRLPQRVRVCERSELILKHSEALQRRHVNPHSLSVSGAKCQRDGCGHPARRFVSFRYNSATMVAKLVGCYAGYWGLSALFCELGLDVLR